MIFVVSSLDGNSTAQKKVPPRKTIRLEPSRTSSPSSPENSQSAISETSETPVGTRLITSRSRTGERRLSPRVFVGRLIRHKFHAAGAPYHRIKTNHVAVPRVRRTGTKNSPQRLLIYGGNNYKEATKRDKSEVRETRAKGKYGVDTRYRRVRVISRTRKLARGTH